MAVSIVDQVNFLLEKAKSKKYSQSDMKTIKSYTRLFSDDMVLGRVFGYSVAAYALATLKWIGSDETLKVYDSLYAKLKPQHKAEVDELIPKKLYLQY